MNTFDPHKMSRRWTWQAQTDCTTTRLTIYEWIDYVLVKKHFMSSVNVHKMCSFPGADIGSDHDLVMMTLHLYLCKTKKAQFTKPEIA